MGRWLLLFSGGAALGTLARRRRAAFTGSSYTQPLLKPVADEEFMVLLYEVIYIEIISQSLYIFKSIH